MAIIRGRINIGFAVRGHDPKQLARVVIARDAVQIADGRSPESEPRKKQPRCLAQAHGSAPPTVSDGAAGITRIALSISCPDTPGRVVVVSPAFGAQLGAEARISRHPVMTALNPNRIAKMIV